MDAGAVIFIQHLDEGNFFGGKLKIEDRHVFFLPVDI